jgi:S1/P1 Nuclease
VKKAKCITALTLVFFSLQATALGWGDPGHMTVAQIAFEDLSAAQQARVNELAALIELDDHEYEFVTSACWMDDIRDFPMFEPIKDWHFITQMFIIDSAVQQKPPPPVNAASIIAFLKTRIGNPKEPDIKKAYYLAELVHLVGDIHQPLHTVTRFTHDEPEGDRGGNLFFLGEGSLRGNLHSYWDAAGGIFGVGNIRRPLSNNGRSRLQQFAKVIKDKVPKDSPAIVGKVGNLNPDVWAKEGFDLREDIYSGIKEQDVPDPNYEKKTQRISRERIALAGYRLAAILKAVTL